MWAYIFKDKGSKNLPEITDVDFDYVIKEYNEFYEQTLEFIKLNQRLEKFITLHAKLFPWFKPEIIQNTNKENLYKFTWILIALHERRLKKKELLNEYTFLRKLKVKPEENTAFNKYFLLPDKIGTLIAFILNVPSLNNFNFLNSGFPFLRLFWAPVGILFRSFALTRFFWNTIWKWLSIIDWILFGIPYILIKSFIGLNQNYFDTERLIGKYLYGKSDKVKKELRNIMKLDSANSTAYFTVLWVVFLREKLVELLIDSADKK